MKNTKRLVAVLLAIIMLLSFAGCHKKNEIAVTIGEIEFTSAYYMCALVSADAEARNLVYEALSDEEKNSSAEIDYYSKKVEDKEYVKWVEDTAMDSLKEIAAYKTLCAENKLELKEEDVANTKAYAEYYWASAGMSAYFEPNGISKETYTKYMTDSYYSESYFEFLYGEGGSKEIASEKVVEAIGNNYVVANIIDGTYGSDMSDDDKTALKAKLEGYLTALNNGSRTFEAIYKEYNQVTEEDAATEETTTEEKAPKDKYATIIGGEDTVYAAEYYDDVKAMAVGEVKLIALDNEAGYVLAVKQDINADEYYKETLDMSARHILADEEFEKDIADYASKMSVKIDKYAIKPFKVKKIKTPEATA